jgi:hypothetical protein
MQINNNKDRANAKKKCVVHIAVLGSGILIGAQAAE